MTTVVWVAALLTAALHVLVFVWEALLLRRRSVYEGVFGMAAADVAPVRLWAFGVGFYNLFLACGLVLGVALWASGDVTVGRALLLYLCTLLVLAGGVLLLADRMALSRERGKGVSGAVAQAGPPLVALVAMLV